MSTIKETSQKGKVWIVDVSMGYGHQRTAYPLRKIALNKKIIHANDYKGMPKRDRETWETGKGFYEFISRFKKVPLVGKTSFAIFDSFQKIFSFYPKKKLLKPSLQLRAEIKKIKTGWGRDLIRRLSKKPFPLISTFFSPAYMAEAFDYPNDIYCVICDADVSRAWAPMDSQKSRIKYFTSNDWTTNRLKLYGVKEENIFLTGYPLPLENIGTRKLEILKKDIKERLLLLDPQKQYFQNYKPLIDKYLGKLPKKVSRPLTLMFAVGGAGAQKELGIEIAKSLKQTIQDKQVKLILVAGIRKEVKNYFSEQIKFLGLDKYLNKTIEILYEDRIEDYFKKFNFTLRKTDILWTKPSELSFYSALGLPIIIAPTIGSQEDFNKRWLLSVGSGISQENPLYTNQWLFDLLNSGRLAEVAMQGFVEVEKLGTLNIQKIIN